MKSSFLSSEFTTLSSGLNIGEYYNYHPKGYRIHTFGEGTKIALDSAYLHWSGGTLAGKYPEVFCPNCATPMFPLFKLNFAADPRLKELNLRDEEILQLLRCFVCSLELNPYWTYFGADSIAVSGGYRTTPPYILQGVQLPYPIRPVELVEIGEPDYPVSEQSLERLRKRRPPEVFHQIGGLPYRGTYKYKPLDCVKCKQPMHFAGIVDNDDMNVYCSESPKYSCTLVIGDCDSLYFYTCKPCKGIGFKWIYG